MELQNRKILLTGATGGIGEQLCSRLAAKGASLLMNCISEEKLQALKAKMGDQHEIAVADISDAEDRQRLVRQAGEFGIDGIINLAGILDFHWYEDQAPALIDKMMQVNLVGPMLLCRELLPLLLTRNEAVIFNIGSTFGSIGHPGFVAYCASKGGLKQFSEALSRELSDSSVRVQYIAPRATVTTLNSARVNALNTALGNRADSPEYVAGAIVNLLENGKQTAFLGWPEKLFVRINGLLPALVHKALAGKLPLIKYHAKS